MDARDKRSTKQTKLKMLCFLLLGLMLLFLFYYLKRGTKGNVPDFGEGLMIHLPSPILEKDLDLDKLRFYERSFADSIRQREAILRSPTISSIIARENFGPLALGEGLQMKGSGDYSKAQGRHFSSSILDKKQNHWQDKLNRFLDSTAKLGSAEPFDFRQEVVEPDVLGQRSWALMQSSESDPELKQLSIMLENLLDMQYPSRMEERKKKMELGKKKVFAVSRAAAVDSISLLVNNEVQQGNGPGFNSFYGWDEAVRESANTIAVVIHQSQTIEIGSVVKLRLLEDIRIQNCMIPKNNFLFAKTHIVGERIEVQVVSIRYKSWIYTVDLTAYDLDGIRGINIPVLRHRDPGIESIVPSVGFTALNDSWQAQAAGLGVQAAKKLFSKKLHGISVEVKAGYQLLLYDNSQ